MIKRKLLNQLLKYIDLKEIIVIHGARQVGKTTLMKMLIEHLEEKKITLENIIYFDLENQKYLDLCNAGVDEFMKYIDFKTNVKNKRYIFIDEIQYLDNPSSFLKQIYDHYSNTCKLIVSGSSSFEIKRKFKDSMAGRFFEFELFGLDFEEFLEFKNIKYNLLQKGNSFTINEELKKWFKEFIIYGGYPRVALLPNEESKEKYIQNILGTYLRKDIREIGNVRDVNRFNKILKILSVHNGLLNINEIASTLGISRPTIKDSIALLENTYIIKTVRPFYTNIRSELSKMPKIYFEDNGLRNILRFGEFVNVIDGLMFENAIFSILRKKGNELKFWRTKSGQEIDFIIAKKDKIFGYEVKQTYSGKNLSAFKSFTEKYPKSNLKVLSLNINETTINNNPLFPWEI
ncbi:ATP-binding protein [bacterium]|nr:ATP-binding protein [bacterium]